MRLAHGSIFPSARSKWLHLRLPHTRRSTVDFLHKLFNSLEHLPPLFRCHFEPLVAQVNLNAFTQSDPEPAGDGVLGTCTQRLLIPVWRCFRFHLRRDKLRIARRREGRYLLRSNLTGTDPGKHWPMYLQLTQVEQAFKDLKDDLDSSAPALRRGTSSR